MFILILCVPPGLTFEQVQGADAPLPALPPPKDTLAWASASGPINPRPLQSLQPLRSLWKEATWAWTWSLQWNVPNCQQRQLATFHFAKPMEANPWMPTPSCQSRGAFVILCPHPWGELFGKSLRLQRLVAELKVLRHDMVHAKM